MACERRSRFDVVLHEMARDRLYFHTGNARSPDTLAGMVVLDLGGSDIATHDCGRDFNVSNTSKLGPHCVGTMLLKILRYRWARGLQLQSEYFMTAKFLSLNVRSSRRTYFIMRL